jgi:PKD repeat protein
MYGFSSQDYAQDMIQTADKGFALVGSTRDPNSGDDDIYFVKTDEEGNVLWSKSYGGSSYDYGYGVTELADGSFVMVGYTSSFSISQDIIVIKTDNLGNVLWSKIIGDDNTDYAFDVEAANDGGVLICGKSRAPFTSGMVTYNVDNAYLIKLDANGDEKWSKLYGESITNDIAYKIIKMTDGYLLSGESNSYSTGEYDLMMIKTDTNGSVQWANKYGFDGAFDYGGYANATNDGGLILCGQKQEKLGSKNYDWMLVKTDSKGDAGCNNIAILPTEANANILITSVTINDSALSSIITPGITTGSYTSYSDSLFCFNQAQLMAYYSYTGDACGNGSVSFSDFSTNAISWSWNFGDPNSGNSNFSTQQNPSHAFSSSGNYDVTLMVTDANANTDSITLILNVSLSANPVDLGKDTSICGDEIYILSAGPDYASYLWSSGSTDSVIQVGSIGTYWVKVTDANGCVSTDTILISQCGVTKINQTDNKINVLIYPNPFNEELFIHSLEQITLFEIYDVYGRLVKSTNEIINQSVSTASLEDGVYQIKIYFKESSVNKTLIKK